MDGSSENIRVLHVDDEPDFSKMAAEFLERQDDRLDVNTATSASEALTRLSDTTVDCIVSDFDMPGKNGIEFLEAVREEYPDLPFILYTGKGSEEVASDAISAGVTEYLQKETGTSQYEVLAKRIENAVERQRAQKAAAETEQRLRTIAKNTNDILWKFTADWDELLFINSPYEEIWGRSIDELRNEPQSFFEGIHPDDRAAVEDAMGQLSAGESVDIEYRVNADEDYGRWVWVQGEPVIDETDEVAKVVGFARDISERKKRERDLIRFEAYIKESSDAITVLDEDGTIKYQSPAVERILGYGKDEFTAQNGFDYIHPDDQDEVYDMFTELVAEPSETVTVEARFKTADDEWRWLEVRGSNRFNHDAINGIVTVSRDITDRKHHQQELDQTNTVLSALFDTLPVGVLAEDADRNVLAANERLFDHFEFIGSPDEITGADCERMAREVSELFVEPEQFVSRINEVLTRGESVRNEELVHQDGRRFARDYEMLELPEGTGHLWVYRDITDLKNREEALQRERDRLDEFAGVVSHDLRNPLNVAAGRLELAQEKCDSEHLDAIETALHRINRITEDVLWLSREGQDIGSMDEVVFSDAIDAAWNIVADHAEHAELHYADDALPTARIEADDNRLRQLLENLFSNAIGHGGENVTATVGALDTGFYVEDDGPGISEDEREELFTAGYSTSDEGTGFGLSIVKQIAEAHDWKIQVGEGTDGGARFEVTGVKLTAE